MKKMKLFCNSGRVLLPFSISFLLLFLLIQSCTKKDEGIDQRQIDLDNWVDENVVAWANINSYNLEKTSSGLYFVSIQEGAGSTPTANDYVLVSATAKKLDGTVFSTDSSEVAKASGIYDYKRYYGTKLYSIKGLNKSKFSEALLKMKEGEKARLLYTLPYDEIRAADVTINLIKIYHTSEAYEDELINPCLANQMQNSQVIEDGIYIKKIQTNSNGNSINELDRVNVSYMIWGLNNQLMDTNIEDSAKANGIYNPSLSYIPLSFSAGSAQFISGFNKVIFNMKYEESAYSVFSSKFGYGAEGNSYIPGFCPLKMYVKIHEDPSVITVFHKY